MKISKLMYQQWKCESNLADCVNEISVWNMYNQPCQKVMKVIRRKWRNVKEENANESMSYSINVAKCKL
jgi:hypothetical protein